MAPLLFPLVLEADTPAWAHSKTLWRRGSYQHAELQCETLHGRARVNMDDDGVQSMLADITMQTDSF